MYAYAGVEMQNAKHC